MFRFFTGINCYEMADAIRDIYQRQASYSLQPIYGDTDEPSHYQYLLDITHRALNGHFSNRLLLLNFQQLTDPTGFRSQIWKTLCRFNGSSAFVKCINKSNGVDISALPDIYTRNRRYPFWLSPHGNGLDCHRTWEALYLDAIPIVWNSTLNPLYAGLPVLVLNHLNQLTERFLRDKLKEISINKLKLNFYRLEKLRFSFWQRLILSKSRHSLSTTIQEHRCWRGTYIIK